MTKPAKPRLLDMAEAIDRVRSLMQGVPLEAFERDWQQKWIVERGIEIISEASRHLPPELKERHPNIPWQKVAGIGNVLRHEYGNVAAAILRKLVRDDLAALESVCLRELGA
jgi:uncharacterized protein with HEPN domain